MGEAAKKLKELLAEGDQDGPLVKALGTAEDIFGTMSGLYGYYGAAKDILGKLGFLGKPDDPLAEIAGMLNYIKGQLDAILGEILVTQGKIDAASKLTTFQLTDEQFTWSKTAFDDAKDFIGSTDPGLKAGYDISLEHSWNSLNTLSLISMHYWQRLFVEDGLGSDAWTPPFYPDDVKPGSDYMWDYRLVLPDYIQSLQRHVFAVSANTAEYQKQKLDDLANFGKFLFESVYEKIVAGFAHISTINPRPTEVCHIRNGSGRIFTGTEKRVSMRHFKLTISKTQKTAARCA